MEGLDSGLETQPILKKGPTPKAMPAKGLFALKPEMHSPGTKHTAKLQNQSATMSAEIHETERKLPLSKTESSSAFLTQNEIEFAARSFSKHLFKDPNVISSTHFEINNKTKKHRTRSPSNKSVLMVGPPLPTKKYKALSVTFDENDNIILNADIPIKSQIKSAPTCLIHRNSVPDLSAGSDFTRQLKSILKSADPLRNIDGTSETQRQFVPPQEANKIRDVQQTNCRRKGLNYLSRNTLEIDLTQIKEDDGVDSNELNKLERHLIRLAKLLMISGIIMLVFILIMATMNSAIFDFLREYFVHHQMLFIFFLGTIVHPTVIGIYCLLALSSLNHVRPYFLRVPFTLTIPCGFLMTSIQYFCNVSNLMEPYLMERMNSYLTYANSKFVWDKLHYLLSCCGINSSKEWTSIMNTTGHGRYPKSCCIIDEPGCPNFALPNLLHSEGCLINATNLHLVLAGFMILMSIVQSILLMLSIYFMRKLFNLIKTELQDTRSSWKIIFGKFYSICESAEYDEQQELEEQEQIQFKHFIKTLPTTMPNQNQDASSVHVDENGNEVTATLVQTRFT